MTRIAREITWLAFGRAVVAVSRYISAVSVHRPEQGNAILRRMGREMGYLPEVVEQLVRLRVMQEPKEQR